MASLKNLPDPIRDSIAEATKNLLPGSVVVLCHCEHCDYVAYVIHREGNYPDYCPNCGLDCYGVPARKK